MLVYSSFLHQKTILLKYRYVRINRMLVYKMDRLIFFKIVFEKSYHINIDI